MKSKKDYKNICNYIELTDKVIHVLLQFLNDQVVIIN